MKNLLFLFISMSILLVSCCNNYEGYDRYVLKVDCQTVTIDGIAYQLTQSDATNDFIINDETLHRGIMRKVRPWLYIHYIDEAAKTVDVTFDNGAKEEYPLYIGSSGSIFSVFSKPWDIEKSTCLSFADGYWLVSHRWGDNGIYFDLQKNMGDPRSWSLIDEIFVANDGTGHTIPVINVNILIENYSATAETAIITVTQI